MIVGPETIHRLAGAVFQGQANGEMKWRAGSRAVVQ